MLLRYTVPVTFSVLGESLDKQALTAHFVLKRLHGEISLAAQGEPLSFDFEGHALQSIAIDHLCIRLGDSEEGSFGALVTGARWDDLLAVLTEVADYCTSQIRSTGYVAHLHVVGVSGREPARLALYRLHAEVSEDDTNWRDLIKESDLLATRTELIAGLVASQPHGYLYLSRWQSVSAALAQGSNPDPAAQCLVNAEEYLEIGDLRLAVLESVMSLELALASYLRLHCEQTNGMSKDQIATLLSPSVTLEIRLKVLLPLCLGKQKLSDDTMKKLLKVVNWRNNIVHRQGDLPGGIPRDVALTSVQETITVVRWLRVRTGSDEKWDSFL